MALMSAWLPESAKSIEITKASGTVTDSMCPHGFQTSLHPGAAAWTTGTSVVSSYIKDLGGLSRRSNPECEPFFISGIVIARSQGDPTAEGQEGLHIYCLLNNLYVLMAV